MLFRRDANHLDQRRRGSEPSPAIIIHGYEGFHEPGYGMAEGSYTESMRKALWAWMEVKYGTMFHPLTFDYKLHRRQIISVIGSYPYIKHLPDFGRGKRGFLLELTIDSVNGVAFGGPFRRQYFAWNRIVGRDRFLALPVGDCLLYG